MPSKGANLKREAPRDSAPTLIVLAAQQGKEPNLWAGKKQPVAGPLANSGFTGRGERRNRKNLNRGETAKPAHSMWAGFLVATF